MLGETDLKKIAFNFFFFFFFCFVKAGLPNLTWAR